MDKMQVSITWTEAIERTKIVEMDKSLLFEERLNLEYEITRLFANGEFDHVPQNPKATKKHEWIDQIVFLPMEG